MIANVSSGRWMGSRLLVSPVQRGGLRHDPRCVWDAAFGCVGAGRRFLLWTFRGPEDECGRSGEIIERAGKQPPQGFRFPVLVDAAAAGPLAGMSTPLTRFRSSPGALLNAS